MKASTRGAVATPVVRIVLVTELRRAWRPLLLLAALATLWAAVTMSAIGGARRTASVVERFQRVTLASDATFGIPGDFHGEALHRALRARPEVHSADLLWSAGTGLAYDRGIFVNLTVGATGSWGRDFDRPIVLRGRTADPASPDEVVVSTATAELLDVDVGDHLDIPTWDKQEWDAWQKVHGAYPPFNGPRVRVHIVGVVRLASDLAATQEAALLVVATPAFVERWDTSIGQNERAVVVSLDDPDLEPATLIAPLAATLGEQVTVSSSDELYAAHLRDAVRALTVGLVVLASSAGLTGALLVGFAVSREVRRSAGHLEPLRALGATRRQRALVQSAPIAVVAIVTTVPSVLIAWWASAWLPVGPARPAEPTRGRWFDLTVVVCAVPIVFAVMIAAAVFVSVRTAGGREHGRRSLVRPAAVLGRVGPASMVGSMNVLRSRERRSTLVAAVVTLLGLTATVWFAQSLRQLGNRPERWGYTWSASPELGFAADDYRSAVESTLTDPDVSGISLLVSQTAIVGGRPVEISTFIPEGGQQIRPVALDGRLPIDAREIALGRRTADALGVGIGDTVRIDSVNVDDSRWKVVGVVVPPTLLSTTRTGEGAFTSPYGHADLFEGSSVVTYMAMSYRPGANARVVERRLAADPGWYFGARSHARQPGAIASLAGVSVLLPWLAGFFVALGLGATTLAVVRRGTRRGRDIRILRAVGFAPGDLRRCALVEASLIAGVGVALGVPLGLLAGRWAWRLTTADLGVDATQPRPLTVVLAAVGVTVVATLIASLLGARRVVVAGPPSKEG